MIKRLSFHSTAYDTGHDVWMHRYRVRHRDNRKPWSPTRATKRGGGVQSLILASQARERNEPVTAAYYAKCATVYRRAHILRSGANWYCNDCGRRFPCTKCVLQNRPPKDTPPETYRVPCANARGLAYSTPGTYHSGDWTRFAYSL